MARAFDGTNDRIITADNAITGINTVSQSTLVWLYQESQPTANQWAGGTVTDAGTGNRNIRRLVTGPPVSTGFVFRYSCGSTTGTSHSWDSDDRATGTWHSCAATIDRSTLSTGTPDMWVNGSSVTPTRSETGGSTALTGDDTVRLGENASGGADLNARIGPFAIIGSAIVAADANRFHWWGAAPGGPSTMEVWLPLWTDNLRNKGVGGDIAYTATGTTMTAMPKIERCWASTMGCGR